VDTPVRVNPPVLPSAVRLAQTALLMKRNHHTYTRKTCVYRLSAKLPRLTTHKHITARAPRPGLTA
jgi:hypothetical protein